MMSLTMTCSHMCNIYYLPIAPSCTHFPLISLHFLLQTVLFYFQVLHIYIFKTQSPHRDKIYDTCLSVSSLLLLRWWLPFLPIFLFIQLLTWQKFSFIVGRMQRGTSLWIVGWHSLQTLKSSNCDPGFS